MKKAALALLPVFASMHVAADNMTTPLEYAAISCHIAHHNNASAELSCLSNTQKLVKQATLQMLSKLGERDKIHLLNTKALELALQNNSCLSIRASEVVKMDCSLQSDLSLLRYIGDRYAEN